jgi:hypothetical protein
MPKGPPPPFPPGTPAKTVLPPGTLLYRVHKARRSAIATNPVPSHIFYGGGRFDATERARYGYLYAGLTAQAAVGEVLLRSLPFDPGGGNRLLHHNSVAGRRLSFLRTTAELSLVSLVTGRDLAAVAQDSWLVQTESGDYPFTRDWGHWIREHTGPWAQGFLWPSKREPADRAVVLFADRCPEGLLADSGERPVDLDTPKGMAWLNDLLDPYATRLAPPPPSPD